MAESEKSEDSKKQLHVYSLDNGIIVFKFEELSRRAFQQYLDYVRKYNGQYPDPLRVLYDFRGAGLPGLPFLELHSEALDGLHIPRRMRFAHLVDAMIAKHFHRTLMARLPTIQYEHEVFVREDEVIEWLMRPFENEAST